MNSVRMSMFGSCTRYNRIISASTFKRCFSKSTPLADFQIHRAGANRLNKMLCQQKEILQKKLKREARNIDKQQKPNKLSFDDNRKTEAFSKLFKQDLLLVLYTPGLRDLFNDAGLIITKVRFS